MPTVNTKLYPRSVVKRIAKAHTKCNTSKNVDVLLYLDYVLFLQKLMNEAGIEAKQAKTKTITARHIRKVQTVRNAYSEKDGTVILMLLEARAPRIQCMSRMARPL